MKKILLFIVVVITVSCGTQTNDDKINEAFSEYVNLNFDDPSKVKEIVGITYGDTLTNQYFAGMVSDLSVMSDSLESVTKSLEDKANELANKYGQRVRKNESFRSDWMKYEESLRIGLEKRWSFVSAIMSDDFIPISKDSILKYQDFALLDFTIKYRIIENNDLKLKERKGYFDLETSTVYWKETETGNLFDLLKGVSKTIDYYKSVIEIDTDAIEKSQKVISYFE